MFCIPLRSINWEKFTNFLNLPCIKLIKYVNTAKNNPKLFNIFIIFPDVYDPKSTEYNNNLSPQWTKKSMLTVGYGGLHLHSGHAVRSGGCAFLWWDYTHDKHERKMSKNISMNRTIRNKLRTAIAEGLSTYSHKSFVYFVIQFRINNNIGEPHPIGQKIFIPLKR